MTEHKPPVVPVSTYIPDVNNEYNRRMQQESLQRQGDEIRKNISKLEEKIVSTYNMNLHVTDVMDLIEEIVKSCGGESKVEFVDVSYDFIRVKTRFPITANLFQFMGEDEKNPRYHKVVTKLLLQVNKVYGVRWIPNEDRGSYIIISLKRD